MSESASHRSILSPGARGPAAARSVALIAAAEAGIEVRPLAELGDARRAEALLRDVWLPTDGCPPVAYDLIRAFSSAGGYAVGAYDGDVMVGACVGFWASPDDRSLHSHVSGVTRGHRSRRVGYAMKLDQRAYALEHFVQSITWTFDPLVARNAHFNLRRLGARPLRYEKNYYGAMTDSMNGADESDRFLVRWDLTADPKPEASGTQILTDGSPARAVLAVDRDGGPRVLSGDSAEVVTVAVPSDIEGLREEDPERARAWRKATRKALVGLLEEDATVVDFDRDNGYYIVQRGVR